MWQFLRLPAVLGHPRPLLQTAAGSGEWLGDGWQLPLLHGPPFPLEDYRPVHWADTHIPSPQRLYAHPDLLVFDFPPHVPFNLQPSRCGAGETGQSKLEAAVCVSDAEVFQHEGLQEEVLSDLGFWDCNCCSGVLCTLHASGELIMRWRRLGGEGEDA